MKKLLSVFLSALLLSLPGLAAEPKIKIFHDLSDVSWAAPSIYRLADQGIIQGTSEHLYSPNDDVIRGDLALLLCRIFGLSQPGESGFADVPADSYYAAAINALRLLGVARGEGESRNFYPERAATRQETMAMAGALLMKGEYITSYDETLLNHFPDQDQLLPENRKFAAALIGGGFIMGNADGTLDPNGRLTRAQAAVILDRVREYVSNK